MQKDLFVLFVGLCIQNGEGYSVKVENLFQTTWISRVHN